MKQLIEFDPIFNPIDRTLDFSALPDFDINKLYGVINLTRNQPIYAPGASGLGLSAFTKSIVTLQFDTTTYASRDKLNVYYKTGSIETNTPVELGGQAQLTQETANQILIELKLMNWILSQGLNINREDVTAMRDDLNNTSNI